MRTTNHFARGIVLLAIISMVVSFGTAAFDAAHAASKKARHTKPSHAHATTTSSGGGAQPAPPGPPDPGVYK